MRECYSCGSLAGDTPFPGARKPRKRRDLCCSCAAERLRAPPVVTRPAQTRAAYRAALRHRAKLAQLDLVDLVVRAP